jgi:hypothetical protein
MKRYTGLIENYRSRLPVSESTRIISLGEGHRIAPYSTFNRQRRENLRQI